MGKRTCTALLRKGLQGLSPTGRKVWDVCCTSALWQRNAIGEGQLLSSLTHSANSLALVTYPMAFPGLNNLVGGHQRNRRSSRQSWPAPHFFLRLAGSTNTGCLGGVPLIGATTQTRVAEKMLAQIRNRSLALLPCPFTWTI